MSRQGAVTGMVTGLLFTLGYIIFFKFLGGSEEDWLFGISPEGIGTVGMILNLLVSLVINRFTPDPPEEIQQVVEDIRYPRDLYPRDL
jgi:cation/acetate symporter